MNAGCAGTTEISWERVPYLSALEVRSRRGTIQIHVYLPTYLILWLLPLQFRLNLIQTLIMWHPA